MVRFLVMVMVIFIVTVIVTVRVMDMLCWHAGDPPTILHV